MRTYEQLRRDRYDRNLSTFGNLIQTIEDEYMRVSGVKSTGDVTNINTYVTIPRNLTPELEVFLSDYMWLTGIPMVVIQGDNKTYITISEPAFANK